MFRFSIRDLLLLTVIVALALGWWVDRSRLATERDQAVSEWYRFYKFAADRGETSGLARVYRNGLLRDSKP